MALRRPASLQEARSAQDREPICRVRFSGVPKDYVLAHMWSNLSAAQGNKTAAAGRDAVTKLLTAEQIVEAQRLAREWKPK